MTAALLLALALALALALSALALNALALALALDGELASDVRCRFVARGIVSYSNDADPAREPPVAVSLLLDSKSVTDKNNDEPLPVVARAGGDVLVRC